MSELMVKVSSGGESVMVNAQGAAYAFIATMEALNTVYTLEEIGDKGTVELVRDLIAETHKQAVRINEIADERDKYQRALCQASDPDPVEAFYQRVKERAKCNVRLGDAQAWAYHRALEHEIAEHRKKRGKG